MSNDEPRIMAGTDCSRRALVGKAAAGLIGLGSTVAMAGAPRKTVSRQVVRGQRSTSLAKSQSSPDLSEVPTITAMVGPNAMGILLPGGDLVNNLQDYHLEMESLTLGPEMPFLDLDVTVDTGGPILSTGPQTYGALWERKGFVGKYFIRLSLDWGYVAGCIKKNLTHVGLTVKDSKTDYMYIDLHLAKWWDGGWKLGAYDSGWSKFCTVATFSYSSIKDAITNALLAVGLAAVAVAIAELTAALVFSTLLLAA